MGKRRGEVIFYLCVHVNDHDVNDHFYVCNLN